MPEGTEVVNTPTPTPAPAPTDPRVALLETNIALATAAAENSRKIADAAIAEKAALQATAAETTAALQSRLVRSEAKARAIQHGIVNASLADTLPITAASVAADGSLSGVEEQVTAWKTSYPEIFEKRAPGVSPVAPVPAGTSTVTPSPVNVRTMNPTEYKAWLSKASADAAKREARR